MRVMSLHPALGKNNTKDSTSARSGSNTTLQAAATDNVQFSDRQQPRFGCRMFAYMNAQPQPGQNRLLKNCLLTGHNSLRDQARLRPPQLEHDRVMSWEDLQGVPHSKDGWGISSYSGGSSQPSSQPWITKQSLDASEDPAYKQAVEHVLTPSDKAQLPHTLLGHVRAATARGHQERAATTGQVSLENTHPFQYGVWTLMHNGSVSGEGMDKVRHEVNTRYAATLGQKPQGQTDSEASFHYILGKLQERYPDQGAKKLKAGLPDVPPTELLDTFAGAVRDLIQGQQAGGKGDTTLVPLHKQNASRLAGVTLSDESRTEASPICNFVMTNGNTLMASAYGHKLFLGVRQDKKATNGDLNSEVVLASEKMQPKGWFTPKLNWVEIPNAHCVMLERTPAGVKVTLRAL